MQSTPGYSTSGPTEFPRTLLPFVCCPRDAAPLIVTSEIRGSDIGLVEAILTCHQCSHAYHIEDGILCLLTGEQTPEDAHEIALRDAEYDPARGPEFVPPATGWRSVVSDRIEIPPFLTALTPLDGRLVLEIGCGDGRLTLLMAQMGARVLAVDFSLHALRKLAVYLPTGLAPTTYNQPPPSPAADLRPRVGLVQANASQLHVASGRFDRALSTTPLDSRAQRLALYASLASALKDEGCFIGSVEYDNLRHRSLGFPVARRYSKGGIFIEYFDVATVRREIEPFFGSIQFSFIRPTVPFLGAASPDVVVAAARLTERIPGLRQLGEILLFRGTRPYRPPAEEVWRRGSRLIRFIYDWRLRRRGQSSKQEEYPI